MSMIVVGWWCTFDVFLLYFWCTFGVRVACVESYSADKNDVCLYYEIVRKMLWRRVWCAIWTARWAGQNPIVTAG